MLKISDFSKKLFFMKRQFHVISFLQKDESTPKRKVKETVELVTLIDSSDKILGIKTKTESEKLARKHNLILVPLEDSKYGKKHPAYKLTPSSDAFEGSTTKEPSIKSLKKLPLNFRISDHDLETKVQIVKKWLNKSFQVHIAISGTGSSESSRTAVFEKVKNKVSECSRILDVRDKADTLKFIVIPPKKITQPSSKSTQSKTIPEVENHQTIENQPSTSTTENSQQSTSTADVSQSSNSKVESSQA